MIAAATGNPMANAPPIAKMNAESRFTSGRRLSTDIFFFINCKVKKLLS